jgi:hypothetical protein
MSNIDKHAVQAVADLKAGYTLGHADVAILNELARIALASLEAEPVGWLYSASFERGHVEGELTDAPGCDMPVYTAPPAPVANGEYGDAYQGAREDLAIWKRRALEAEEHVQRLEQINDYLVKEAQGESRMGEPLITPPAPVSVPDEMTMQEALSAIDQLSWQECTRDAYMLGWNACRVAMLQGAERVTTANKLPGDFDFDRFNDVVWLEAVASNPHMHSPTTSTIAMVALELNKRLEAGNSPVIPGGWVVVPVDMTPEQMRAVQFESELGSYAAANLSGAYSLFREFWDVAVAATPQQEAKNV